MYSIKFRKHITNQRDPLAFHNNIFLSNLFLSVYVPFILLPDHIRRRVKLTAKLMYINCTKERNMYGKNRLKLSSTVSASLIFQS